MAKERIGILGGTFNPVHQGHIAMARAARDSFSLDRVLLLPDSVPPHKKDIAPGEDRWRMVCAAAAGEERLEPSRIELDREGTTYTYDTLTELHAAFPKAGLYYLIGADTLMELHNWHRFQEVLGLCTFLICPRRTACSAEALRAERQRLTALGGSFQDVPMPPVEVSSTALRAALAEETPSELLSPLVREYSGIAGLYGQPPRVAEHEAWLSRLFSDLSRKRFAHTLGVAYTARSLAQVHGVDVEKAEIAALLHDCAKCMPLKEQQRICKEQHLTEDESLTGSVALLHALVGSWMAEAVYGVHDPEILQAIACHTTGRVGMTPLDMTVFLADKIEPTRAPFPVLNRVRMMAPLSLERAVLASMEGTAGYVGESGKVMHPSTLESMRWLRQRVDSAPAREE